MDLHVGAKVKMVSKQNTGRKSFFFFVIINRTRVTYVTLKTAMEVNEK